MHIRASPRGIEMKIQFDFDASGGAFKSRLIGKMAFGSLIGQP